MDTDLIGKKVLPQWQSMLGIVSETLHLFSYPLLWMSHNSTLNTLKGERVLVRLGELRGFIATLAKERGDTRKVCWYSRNWPSRGEKFSLSWWPGLLADLRSAHLSATCGKPLKVYTHTPAALSMYKHTRKCTLISTLMRNCVTCIRTRVDHFQTRVYRQPWNRVKISTEDQTSCCTVFQLS